MKNQIQLAQRHALLDAPDFVLLTKSNQIISGDTESPTTLTISLALAEDS